MSKIEWTEKTWNPVTGCTKISEGCKKCYAERMAKRLKGRYGYPDDDPFRVAMRNNRLGEPFKWNKPTMCFVCSMGDMFHENVDCEFLDNIFYVIKKCPQHTFQILTKRPKRMLDYVSQLVYKPFKEHFPNVWLGVSAENQKRADERIPVLLDIPATVRFVSCEPMLGKFDLALYLQDWINVDEVDRRCDFSWLQGLDWVIAGGETGSGARLVKKNWVREIRKQCSYFNVPFFLKQLNKKGDRELDGNIWEEMPCV